MHLGVNFQAEWKGRYFEVSMDYIVGMEVVNALQGLREELEGLGLTVDVFGVLVVE